MNKQPLILGKVNSPVCAYILQVFQLEPVEINKFLKINIENGFLNINDNVVFIADKHLMAKNSSISLIKKTCDIRKINIVGVIGEDAEIWNKALNLQPINEKLRMNLNSEYVKVRTEFLEEIKKEEQRKKELLEENLNIVNILVQDSISRVEQSEKEIFSNIKKENTSFKQIQPEKILEEESIPSSKIETFKEKNVLVEIKSEKVEIASIIKSIEEEDNPTIKKIRERLDEIKKEHKSKFKIDEKEMPEIRLNIEKNENRETNTETNFSEIKDLQDNPFDELNNIIKENQQINNFNKNAIEDISEEIVTNEILDEEIITQEKIVFNTIENNLNDDSNLYLNEDFESHENPEVKDTTNALETTDKKNKKTFNLSDFLKTQEEPKPDILKILTNDKHNQLNDEHCNTTLKDAEETIKIFENGMKKETKPSFADENNESNSYEKPLRIKGRVRSGCRHIHSGDIILEGSVHPGGELIAKGDIHIYGKGSGRLFAGMDGNEKACIYINSFNAEIVSIAGNYYIMEDINNNLIGKPIKISFKDNKLYFEEIKEINKFVA